MKFSNLFSHSSLLLIIPAILLITGCNNPAGSGEEEHEHPRPTGIVLKMNGNEIVRYEDEITGQIEVNAGEETALITLYFLDEHGDEFQYDEPEYSLDWTGIDESVAEIEQHAEDGKWSFHVRGIASENTSVVFQLLHGDHPDYYTLEIPIIVN